MGEIIKAIVIIVVTVIITLKVSRKNPKETDLNKILTDILDKSFSSDELSTVTNEIIEILRKYYNVDYITILVTKDNKKLQVLSSNVDNKYIGEIQNYSNIQLKKLENSVVKLNISNKDPLEYGKHRKIRLSLFAPLIYKNNLVGAVLIESSNLKDVRRNNLREEIYGKLFNSTALVIQNLINTERLVTMLSTDQLTGVYNRRYMDNKLIEEIKHHKECKKTFNLVILDIDYFKKFNDTYGHQFGDVALQEVSQFIKKSVRQITTMNRRKDWVARYGGEEFVIVFSESNQQAIFKKVDQIRKGLSEYTITDGFNTAGVTVSFGIATFPYHGWTPEELIEKADQALYESKNNGRNRVTIAK